MRRIEPTTHCWIDGKRVSPDRAGLPLDDPTLQTGAGLFETIALRDGTVLDLDEHLERMANGARRLDIPLPETKRLRELAFEAAAASSGSAWLKIVLSGGGRLLAYSGAMDPDDEGSSATAVLLPWRRSLHDPLQGFKSLSYAGNRIGLEEANRRGADEGLWLNARGHLAEGSTSNLFVVWRGKLLTPAVGEGILPGVVREQVLAVAREMSFHVIEGKLRLRRLEQATEAFLTSSLRAVRPLVRYQGRPVGSGSPGALTRRIASEVRDRRRSAAAGQGASQAPV